MDSYIVEIDQGADGRIVVAIPGLRLLVLGLSMDEALTRARAAIAFRTQEAGRRSEPALARRGQTVGPPADPTLPSRRAPPDRSTRVLHKQPSWAVLARRSGEERPGIDVGPCWHRTISPDTDEVGSNGSACAAKWRRSGNRLSSGSTPCRAGSPDGSPACMPVKAVSVCLL